MTNSVPAREPINSFPIRLTRFIIFFIDQVNVMKIRIYTFSFFLYGEVYFASDLYGYTS